MTSAWNILVGKIEITLMVNDIMSENITYAHIYIVYIYIVCIYIRVCIQIYIYTYIRIEDLYSTLDNPFVLAIHGLN